MQQSVVGHDGTDVKPWASFRLTSASMSFRKTSSAMLNAISSLDNRIRRGEPSPAGFSISSTAVWTTLDCFSGTGQSGARALVVKGRSEYEAKPKLAPHTVASGSPYDSNHGDYGVRVRWSL